MRPICRLNAGLALAGALVGVVLGSPEEQQAIDDQNRNAP
jgi:hypothetical protein